VPERTIQSPFLTELACEHVRTTDLSDEVREDSVQSGPGSNRAFAVGSLVVHPRFGVGRVQWISGGSNARARVSFRDVGVKTLVLEYAGLKAVGQGRR